jgi:16S rRNA (cytosine1402-N4)-methyltransferase
LDAAHVPVLVAESVAWIGADRPGAAGLVVDATLGLGGHAEALLDAAPGIRLLGIDRDPDARELAARRLARFGDRAEIRAGRFGELREHLAGRRPAAVFADLGVSSLQLDRAGRGFSFRADGPLDVRMAGAGPSAADLLQRTTEAELTEILRSLGEEPEARRVARAIVEARDREPIETTGQLAEIVRRAKRRGRRTSAGRDKLDPATLAFQALRIAVNDELRELESLLEQAIELLEGDGRLVVISYHSLEDRIVKHRMRDAARGEADPITGRTRSETRVLEVLTKKPVVPSEAEVARNPRARSARLRAARRI